MPQASLRPCSKHPRVLLKRKEQCPHCSTVTKQSNAKRWRERKASGHHIYNTARWKKLRKYQLSKEPFCRHCMPRLTPGTDVDHIVEIADGGDPWDENNLQTLCHSCHSRKTWRNM